MCGEAILGIMIPGIILGVVLCSMIFTGIIRHSENLRESMENGDANAQMLLRSFLVVDSADTKPRRTESVSHTKHITYRSCSGTSYYAAENNDKFKYKDNVYSFTYEKRKRM